jgi:hypothetical protein
LQFIKSKLQARTSIFTMRFFGIISALTAVALTHGFVIPSGTTDGVYAVTTRADGTDVHTKIAASSETKRGVPVLDEGLPLERRQSDRIWCGCGYSMDASNCDAAVSDLKNQLSAQTRLFFPT